jgi:hypothetical protein
VTAPAESAPPWLEPATALVKRLEARLASLSVTGLQELEALAMAALDPPPPAATVTRLDIDRASPADAPDREALVHATGPARHLTAMVQVEREIAARLAERLGPDHPDAIAARCSLARILYQAGQADAAIDTIEQVAADRDRVLGPNDPETPATRALLRHWRRDGTQSAT